ncbi:MAG: hypothetical protein WC073_11375 [Sterolibacterium sp.]
MISKRDIARMGQAQKPIPAMIACAGGWDALTPPLFMKSGFVREVQNWECDVNLGYSTVTGYECYDGRPSPSAASYSIITITLTGTISVGDTVTGVTSAATGVVIAAVSGSIAITKVTGTFASGETLNVAAAPQATTTSAAILESASTTLLHAQYMNLAADEYRADIAVPTGSGSSLGGVRFGDVTYTFRNNAGNTATDIWKSTASGWSQVTLFNEVSFTLGGATAPAEGSTLTQGANTALIKRVVLTSGTWAGNNAAGRLIVTTPAPGAFAAGAATVGAINLTLSGAQTAITLAKDGRYQFIVANFGGSVNTKRIYGCDGVNRGFEFDGTVLVPITTGMTTDAPNHVYAHKNHLFFSFLGSVQHSGPGTPYVWSVILGATEIAMGDTVNGFQTQPGSESVGALAIFTRNQTSILYGTGVSNWQLISYRAELGAYAYTVQDVGYTMFLDDQGVTTLQTAQAFGNFAHKAVTEKIKTWLNTKRTLSVDSCVVRDKSQYRLFFSDGYALYVTFDGTKIVGCMPIVFPNAVTWVYSSEDSDGTETIFFGSTNGMVYQMDKGTSFDGAAIEHYLTLAWDFLKTPRLIKRFFDCMFEISGSGYASFVFSYLLGYGSTDIDQPAGQTGITSFASGNWDSGNWDTGVWDGQTLLPSVFDMPGEGENVSISLSGNSDYFKSIKLSGAVIHYAPCREKRG